MSNRHTLNRSAASVGRIHREGLERLYRELPEAFKMKEAKEVVEDWDHGTFLKLRQAGLLETESPSGYGPKDWYLAQQTERWLENELSAAD